jgi:hypothetical protein
VTRLAPRRAPDPGGVAVLTLPLKRGSVRPPPRPVHVNALLIRVNKSRHVPRVVLDALRLRLRWPRVPGAVGLSQAAVPHLKTFVVLSFWTGPDDLDRFVRSRSHTVLMHRHADHVSFASANWSADEADVPAARREATARLRDELPPAYG